MPENTGNLKEMATNFQKEVEEKGFEQVANETYSKPEERSLTFGEKAVGITFNVGNSGEVHQAKQLYANIIDQLNDLRNSTTSGEVKGLCSVAITEAQGAQMWAVKAITWRD